jgi:hypothetical protein
MPVAATYEPIATSTVTGSAATDITFSSIPSTYTDLVLVCFIRSTRTLAYGVMSLRTNGNTSSVYNNIKFFGADGSQGVNGTSFELGPIASDHATASNIFSPCIIHFNNYANTTTHKTIIGETKNNNYQYGVQLSVGTFRSTSAIDTIRVYDGYGGNLAVGTTATLYGITAA